MHSVPTTPAPGTRSTRTLSSRIHDSVPTVEVEIATTASAQSFVVNVSIW